MSNFKVGDRVCIRFGSHYYNEEDQPHFRDIFGDEIAPSVGNPKDIEGSVSELDLVHLADMQMFGNTAEEVHCIRVDWDNGVYNWYRPIDLELSEQGILT